MDLVQVMKMVMPLMSPAAGKIHYELLPGSIMKAGDLIARLELNNLAAITKAEPFTGGFPEMGPPLVFSSTVNDVFKQAHTAAQMIMAGMLSAREGSWHGSLSSKRLVHVAAMLCVQGSWLHSTLNYCSDTPWSAVPSTGTLCAYDLCLALRMYV